MLPLVEVAVLGPVEVSIGGSPVDLGTPKQRALVAALALSGGRPVSVDAIVDLLWGDAPPPGVTTTLQAYVSGLRRVMEPDRERRAPATVLVTVAPGYALRVADGSHDARVFERAVTVEQRRLQGLAPVGPPSVDAGTLTDAVARLDAALALWRGTPYGELEDAAAAVAERARLEELRLVALEHRLLADLALGHHGTAAAELEALTAAHPLRERLWGLRAVALTRSGRQADALDVLRRVRDVLSDELGLDPGPELRDLQAAVLRQDGSLGWVAPPAASAPAPAAEPATEEPAAQAPEPVGLWPMVGRDRDLDELVGALDAAGAGTSSYAVVTGEPGIGKSRLCAELASVARARGVTVLVGRCSQDDGAPPLWAWAQVLEGLGLSLPIAPDDAGDQAGAQFRSREQLVRQVREAARERPLLIALDDLHWADAATLRVLRLLAETSADEQLMVLSTWRPHPEPTGALAEVAEALARRHAVRRELVGLPAAAVAEVFDSVAHNRPSEEQAAALRARTDGNPFFLVEYARLAGERSDLARLVAEEHPPTGVQEVLTRRLDQLPGDTLTALRAAAVIGRQFDLPTLGAVTGADPDDLLDVVEPAQVAGLVREDGIDRFRFSHALVRDTLVAVTSASRRARLHVRVAEALATAPDRATERARHWLAAGPSYAARAWPAAVDAATLASRLYAHEEASDLLRAALEALEQDPEATLRQRYDLLLRLIDAYRWSASWPELTATVEVAVGVAEEMDDPELVATAAISTTQGALWQSAAHGQVHGPIVDALRRSLDRLPASDGALRCRTMLGLANELYYGATFAERRALVDEALAMARRLGDDALLLDACQIAFVSLWTCRTAPERLDLATESLDLARRTGAERAFVVSACLRAVVLAELGRPAEMWEAVAEARVEAERQRTLYGLMVLDSLVLPWHAMAGRFDLCLELIEQIRRLDSQISLEQSEDATAGAMISLSAWQGRAADTAQMLAELADGPLPLNATITAFYWRGGDEDGAREWYAGHPPQLDTDDWFSLLAWGNAAESALYVGDAEVGAATYDLLAPLAGRSCVAGSGNACGPVDAFLALAAAAAGEKAMATQHADDAEQLCADWDIPLAAQWLRDQRERYGF
ncbi:hypothetical protein EKO23_09060 [Nocardioides guangzhouensis]|uniref:OmpR/PhoB-type domain-containing protein n=1 Tax=Nocardioides guangzhouensis TaxID=2497878 RepID=A0A4Q4ZGK0_9ACTN|nr:hypothetical protein EKO23_09060 [Nocardioides guangzhouensis]